MTYVEASYPIVGTDFELSLANVVPGEILNIGGHRVVMAEEAQVEPAVPCTCCGSETYVYHEDLEVFLCSYACAEAYDTPERRQAIEERRADAVHEFLLATDQAYAMQHMLALSERRCHRVP